MNSVKLDPHAPFKRDPPAPHQMLDRLTPAPEVFVLCHLGVPRLDRDRWSMAIDGLVERPRTLRFDDLVRYPKTEVESVHQCCGPRGREWQRFSVSWTPGARGPAVLASLAEAMDGLVQPTSSRRNAVHSVAVIVG